MNEDFFDWLNNFPTDWLLIETSDGESRSYKFIDNTKEDLK